MLAIFFMVVLTVLTLACFGYWCRTGRGKEDFVVSLVLLGLAMGLYSTVMFLRIGPDEIGLEKSPGGRSRIMLPGYHFLRPGHTVQRLPRSCGTTSMPRIPGSQTLTKDGRCVDFQVRFTAQIRDPNLLVVIKDGLGGITRRDGDDPLTEYRYDIHRLGNLAAFRLAMESTYSELQHGGSAVAERFATYFYEEVASALLSSKGNEGISKERILGFFLLQGVEIAHVSELP